MSGTHDARMEEDRETLDELESIWGALGELGNSVLGTRERLAVIHRRLTTQFSERYGERP